MQKMCFGRIITIFIVTVLSVENVQGKQLPSFITTCKKSDPDMSACFMKATEQLRPHLTKGIPELGIPPCDPLVIPKLHLEQPEGANVGFDAELQDLTFTGGINFKILDVKVDLNNGMVYIVINFPHLKMVADYKARGKVLIAQFEGEGKAHGEFENVTLFGDWRTKTEKRGDKLYYKVIKDESNVAVGPMKLEFENLFKDNPQLTDNTNKLINENQEILFSEVKPIVDKTVSEVVGNVVNIVLDKYSTDELFPED